VVDDVVVIWQMEDDVTIDHVDTFHIKRIDCSGEINIGIEDWTDKH
jgi:hypothetical protein